MLLYQQRYVEAINSTIGWSLRLRGHLSCGSKCAPWTLCHTCSTQKPKFCLASNAMQNFGTYRFLKAPMDILHLTRSSLYAWWN